MEELNLSDYFAILSRWKRHFIVCFLLLVAVATAVALSWSNYRSSATVEVEQPQVAPMMTTPTGMNPNDKPESLADLRISRIMEKVTAPSTLVDIITKFNLYPHERESQPVALVAGDMAKKIKLLLITSDIANPAATSKVSADQLSAIAFTLSFDYSDPATAQKVTDEIVTRVLDEDLKDRREGAEATSNFLDNQITTLEASLADQEKKIASFENEHGISGPAAVMFNQQAAETAAMNMQNIDSQIASNEGTQGSVRAQLSGVDPYSRVIADGQVMTTPKTQLKALQAQYASLQAQYSPDYPDVIKTKHQIEALQAEIRQEKGPSSGSSEKSAGLKAQIRDVQTNLSAAEETDGPDNPDVISLRQQLSSLKEQLANTPTDTNAGLSQDADNPPYLALVAQLRSLEEQHKSLEAQRAALSEQQKKYEEALSRDPGLEQEMAVLSRDHENGEIRFRELKERKMAADMDVKMIEDHKGERLVVISPPDLPLHTHPRAIMLFAGGVFLAFCASIALVIAAHILSQSIVGARQLSRFTGVFPLVAIPHLYTSTEVRSWSHRTMFSFFRRWLIRPSSLAPVPNAQEGNE